MAIKLKTPQEIEQIRQAGRIVHQVLERLGQMVAPGVTTAELDAEAARMCGELGGTCLFKGVPGRGVAGPFPGNICASLNEQVVHGIPGSRAIVEGDLVSIDFGVRLNGWCGDAAWTFPAGQIGSQKQRLLDVTRRALDIAIEMCSPGELWSNIARAMQLSVEREGFSVVREFVGHGIGTEMHEDPKVPNFVSREIVARDIVLKPGLVLAVEPMVNMGSPGVKYAPDGWTVVTVDRLPSAHFEHTLAITETGVEILTDGK